MLPGINAPRPPPTKKPIKSNPLPSANAPQNAQIIVTIQNAIQPTSVPESDEELPEFVVRVVVEGVEGRDTGLEVGLDTGRDVKVFVDILRLSHISLSDVRFWL